MLRTQPMKAHLAMTSPVFAEQQHNSQMMHGLLQNVHLRLRKGSVHPHSLCMIYHIHDTYMAYMI